MTRKLYYVGQVVRATFFPKTSRPYSRGGTKEFIGRRMLFEVVGEEDGEWMVLPQIGAGPDGIIEYGGMRIPESDLVDIKSV